MGSVPFFRRVRTRFFCRVNSLYISFLVNFLKTFVKFLKFISLKICKSLRHVFKSRIRNNLKVVFNFLLYYGSFYKCVFQIIKLILTLFLANQISDISSFIKSGRAWLVQLVRSLPSDLKVPALPRFEYLCNLRFRLSQLSFPSFQGKQMRTSVCWELTCDGLVCYPGGVKDSHPLNTTETGYKRRLHGPPGL